MAMAGDYCRLIWAECALVLFRRNSIVVDLNDLRSPNKIFDVLGRDGALHLQLTNTKSHLRYLVGHRTLVCLAEIRNEILPLNTTTWASTGNRLDHNAFFAENLNRQIATIELGGVMRLKTFVDIGKWRREVSQRLILRN